ncbi:glycosyltransferase family 2 protein [Streptacidiphilus sp. EB129]|uniref:glycosyltransferase n=1 Tax=Streptacidiphilus sp. EB129 TaxID=3156262 RepID=UPI003516D040
MTGLLRLDPAQAPIEVVDLELDGPDGRPELRGIGDTSPPDGLTGGGAVLALVRVSGRPVGLLQTVLDGASDPVLALAKAAEPVCDRHRERRDAPEALSAPDPAPLVSVVVATRERPTALARCLDSLARLRYPRFEVVVIDNAPVSEATWELVRTRYADQVRYLREPRRGLAAAHNRGLAESLGEIVAFTDDDVLVDPDWLDALVRGFADPGVGCVTGLILPARLRTPTQILLEARGGFAKGFEQRRYRLDRPPADQPLFPFTAGRLGSGANMAFRTDALRAVGGFDPATGTGTPAKGGDDLLSFFRIVVHGHELVYQPTALVWHHHRDQPQDLDGQAFGYGAGLGAYLTAAVCGEPRMLPALLRRLPSGLRHALASTAPPDSGSVRRSGARRSGAPPDDGGRTDGDDGAAWSARLSWRQRRGMLYGPLGYLRARRLRAAEATGEVGADVR